MIQSNIATFMPMTSLIIVYVAREFAWEEYECNSSTKICADSFVKEFNFLALEIQ